jgi:hypothetical protein
MHGVLCESKTKTGSHSEHGAGSEIEVDRHTSYMITAFHCCLLDVYSRNCSVVPSILRSTLDTAQCIAELIIHASGLAISYSIHPDIIYSSPFPKLNYFLTKHQPYY